jgi:hypothetical protein
MNPVYEVIGLVPGKDEPKRIVLHDDWGGYSRNDAIDYAAMFHGIDQIISIKQGTLEKGIFVASP